MSSIIIESWVTSTTVSYTHLDVYKRQLLNRYGIQPHAVCGRDYVFVNNDPTDMRYENIKLLNPYPGVEIVKTAGLDHYKARIHINGKSYPGSFEFNGTEEGIVAVNTVDVETYVRSVSYTHLYGIAALDVLTYHAVRTKAVTYLGRERSVVITDKSDKAVKQKLKIHNCLLYTSRP